MRIASGLAVNVALTISFVCAVWVQAPDSTHSCGPRPLASGGVVATVLTLGLLTIVIVAIIAVARFVSLRRKRTTEVLILQSQLSDVVAREAVLQGLRINPRARVSGWRKSQVTIEVAGTSQRPSSARRRCESSARKRGDFGLTSIPWITSSSIHRGSRPQTRSFLVDSSQKPARASRQVSQTCPASRLGFGDSRRARWISFRCFSIHR